MKVLVIDVGGTQVKFTVWGKRTKRSFPSGKRMTPQMLVKTVLAMTQDWKYDAVTIGFPGRVLHGRPAADPENIGRGWAKYDFEKGFHKPVKIINDAVMQALGSYNGGRMLFLGLGTGCGSALILDDIVIPLDVGQLAYSRKKVIYDVLSKEALKKGGRAHWEEAVHQVAERLRVAFDTDYLVIGGGNSKRLKRMPRGCRRGSNDLAFTGGARLWRIGALHVTPRKHTWVIT